MRDDSLGVAIFAHIHLFNIYVLLPSLGWVILLISYLFVCFFHGIIPFGQIHRKELGFSSIETFNSNLAVKKMPTYIISK
jgi:hypothetical protein